MRYKPVCDFIPGALAIKILAIPAAVAGLAMTGHYPMALGLTGGIVAGYFTPSVLNRIMRARGVEAEQGGRILRRAQLGFIAAGLILGAAGEAVDHAPRLLYSAVAPS